MDNNEEYNGWTNYETWNVKLWIDNEGSLQFWEEIAESIYNDSERSKYATKLDNAVYSLAENLKDTIANEQMPELKGCYADLLNGALSEVNWHEISRSIFDNVETYDEDGE